MERMVPILFDRKRLRKRRARIAADFAQHNFLHQEAAAGLLESLSFIARPFPTIIELGAGTGQLAKELAARPGTTQYIQCDLAAELLMPASGARVVVDEEWLPFADQSADTIVSVLGLHWINDLPGTLAQIYRILKPDGLFLAVLPGGETLHELRASFAAVETERHGGVTPRVAPFIDVRDGGALLQRAGFALPVADSERLTITYPHVFSLIKDLRGTAENNIMINQSSRFISREFFAALSAYYMAHYGKNDGEIAATVEFVTLTGWKPSPTQQQPARRGSGKISLTEALK
jgi:SAM-dependent methyltransferase